MYFWHNWLCWGEKSEPSLILPPSEEEERPAELQSESVCLCLYMWPIVICSHELWYEVLCSINLLSRRPQCAATLISVHESSYFGALEPRQALKLLTTIKGPFYTVDCVTKKWRPNESSVDWMGFDENSLHRWDSAKVSLMFVVEFEGLGMFQVVGDGSGCGVCACGSDSSEEWRLQQVKGTHHFWRAKSASDQDWPVEQCEHVGSE